MRVVIHHRGLMMDVEEQGSAVEISVRRQDSSVTQLTRTFDWADYPLLNQMRMVADQMVGGIEPQLPPATHHE